MKAKNRYNLIIAALSLALGMAIALQATAQEVLPRPEQPFGGKIGRTTKESTPIPQGCRSTERRAEHSRHPHR